MKTTTRYCRKCGYALQGLRSLRCPECGREFDLADPRSTRAKPKKRSIQYLSRGLLALGIPVLILALAWGALYRGWRGEQTALAEARVPSAEKVMEPRLPDWLDAADHRYARWLKDHLGSASFVLERVTEFTQRRTDEPVRDLSFVRQLPHLETLRAFDNKASDLSPLAGLTNLRWLTLYGDLYIDHDVTIVTDLTPLRGLHQLRAIYMPGMRHLTDISPLATLPELETLTLDGSSVSDLSSLAGLTHLKHLGLGRTPVVDLRPLAGLQLEDLYIVATPVRDLSPMYTVKSLEALSVDKTMPAEQIEALQRALPACRIQQR